MRIAFLIFAGNLAGHDFQLGESNPGVGGTGFTTIQLALRLARAQASWRLTLVNSTPISIIDCPPNLTVDVADVASSFFARTPPNHFTAVVATVESMHDVDLGRLRAFSPRTIAWSRHPFDDRLRRLDSSVGFAAAICVGRYQFYSNDYLKSPTGFIQNIFHPPKIAVAPIVYPDQNDSVNLVHLGALVAGKGFHEIARAWPAISRKWPRARLHVIGSGALYRTRPLHSTLPVTPDYAGQILQSIALADIDAGRVVFHGTMGADKLDVLARSHIALQNPTGASEAFPASTLECMSVGLPVVASADYGMWDSMRHFPELQIHDQRDIVNRIAWLLAQRSRFTELSKRSLEVARRYSNETDDIVAQWVALLQALSDGMPLSAVLTRPLPQPHHSLHFARRILRNHWRIILANTPLAAAWKLSRGPAVPRQGP